MTVKSDALEERAEKRLLSVLHIWRDASSASIVRQLRGDDLHPLWPSMRPTMEPTSRADGIGLAMTRVRSTGGMLAAGRTSKVRCRSSRRTLLARSHRVPATRSPEQFSSAPARPVQRNPVGDRGATSTSRPIWLGRPPRCEQSWVDGGGQATTRTCWEGSSASASRRGPVPPVARGRPPCCRLRRTPVHVSPPPPLPRRDVGTV